MTTISFVMLVLLLVVGTGAIAALFAAGYFNPAEKPAAHPHAGKIAVPRSVRSLKADTKVRREDIYDLTTGDESYFWMDPERVRANPDWVLNLGDIVGRVMARDKETGYVFTEKDFLPPGAREGIVAGIPPGKRAMVVRADDVRGLEFLQRGDRFDLFATLPAKTQRGITAQPATLPAGEQDQFTGGTRPPEAAAMDLEKRLGIKLLVRNGAVAERRSREVTGRRAEPSWDITIAVAADEVVGLTHALGTEHEIFSAARSGHPEETTDDENPAHPLLRGMRPYPVRASLIPAYTRISPTHLIDTATGEVPVVYFPPDGVQPGWVSELDHLVGRVAAHDLHPGFLFQESDFLPPGSRGGVTGGIPPGKMAMPVPADKIQGLGQLQRGDRFDLVASQPVDLKQQFPQLQWALSQQGSNGLNGFLSSLQRQPNLSLVAQEAIVITRSTDTSHVTIAITPEEVPALTRALASGSEIYSIARSGHPDDVGAAALITDSSPAPRISVMEKIAGKKRSLEMFSAPSDEQTMPTLPPDRGFPPGETLSPNSVSPSQRGPIESARPARSATNQPPST